MSGKSVQPKKGKKPARQEAPKKRLLAALEKTLGNATQACRLANVGRQTFYDYLRQDPVFKTQVEDIGEIALDFVESQLFKSIKGGSDTAMIFYLKTKGKKRGYVERQEVTVTEGKDLEGSNIYVPENGR